MARTPTMLGGPHLSLIAIVYGGGLTMGLATMQAVSVPVMSTILVYLALSTLAWMNVRYYSVPGTVTE